MRLVRGWEWAVKKARIEAKEETDLMAIVETLYKSGPTMAIADPLSRLARQENQLDNLDLPLMLEMLLKELPSTVRNALNIRVNAEKDTLVATRIVQRWRKPSNPISNTVGTISDKIDFLISAPYADKLPLKVAELIRKDVPFAVLLPLSLLNEIDRTGKTSVDEAVRKKRLDMKLIIATSLGQGWLVNHPECRVSNSTHAVFFTACPSNEQLHAKGTEAFHTWANSMDGAKISPKTLDGENDIDTLCLRTVHALMKDGASRKKQSPRDVRTQKRTKINDVSNETERSNLENGSVENARDVRAQRRAKLNHVSNETKLSNLEDPFKMVVAPPLRESLDSTCKRTEVHPMHVISTAISPDPLETWPEKQDVTDIKDMVRLTPDQIKKGYPSTLIIIRDDKSRERILVPKCQRLRLVVKEHETMLHVDGTRVHHELSRKFYWPNMIKEIKDICKACKLCQTAKVRRQHLSAAFELAAKEDLPLPRQAYGIDFYGHTHGEILVALDLCTREVSLWFLPDRKMEGVAKALLSGLIFQKGVPLIFVNDEAKEFVDGAVHSMNRYLGIKQITTGGHNPRSNANVERFMQHLTSCLTKCDDTQYRNLKYYIQAIAFAHNTAFNSAINCTPFEAGHGLRARTITEARASPRLQITAEEGIELQEPDHKWESTIFHKVCKLAERLAEDAQRQSQWHKRMNAHNLNQAGKVIPDTPLQPGEKVYFYKPPSQAEVQQRGRKAKHLMHYRGPATITGGIKGRKRQYEFEHNGKRYKRDISMLIPEQTMLEIDVTTLDVTDLRESGSKPKLHTNSAELREEELIICKTDLTDTEWYLAEINKIYADEIEVIYYTTPIKAIENYIDQSIDSRYENLRNARFRKTWIIRDGKNAGKGTIKAPFPSNPDLRVWTGRLPKSELDELVLANNVSLSPQGYLSKDSIDVATGLSITFGSYETIEDEEQHLQSLRQANALYTYAQRTLCTCTQCASCFTSKQNKT